MNWLIAGLGNPGREYEKTRHNLGFMVVDRLAAETGARIGREECRSLIGRAEIEDEVCELVKPLTFMNLSGDAVGCLLQKPDRGIEKLIVISDELALPAGKIRLRPNGSHAGHNGLRSIIDRLGTNEFVRLRIGIAPEHPIADTKNFVLERLSKNELERFDEVVETAAAAVRSVIRNGVERTMAEFN